MMNVQFIIHEEEVFVIEVNPRASRTVPFLSKVTKIPLAQIATQVILGKSLIELGYKDGLYPNSKNVHVKAPVFSFAKLTKVEPFLGPEMKSTGEVMGSDLTLDKALYKAFSASGYKLKDYGTVLFTVSDESKDEAVEVAQRFSDIGYALIATKGTASFFQSKGLKVQTVSKIHDQETGNLLDLIRSNEIHIVINTMGKDREASTDGFIIRREATERGIPLFTSLDTARAIVRVLESRSFMTRSL
jgi:carbamoyl-phosphate synthase large subunit